MTPRRLTEPARLASTAVLRGQADERLVDLTRGGNTRAFEAIVHRYRRPLLRYCARILPPERAEDAVQQTFLSAYNAISTGDGDLNLRPWLYRIARNSALNLLRQNGWNHEQLDEQFDGVMRPDQAVEGRERIRSLVASVKGLPERQRDAIVLRELEGRSYEEIAVALGVTDGAVRQLLNRARTTLRAGATALTPYGLAERIAAAASGRGAAVGERIAEMCSGASGALSLTKVGTAVLVAGAVATGGANQGLPGLGGGSAHKAPGSADAAVAASGGDHAADGPSSRGRVLSAPGEPAATRHGHGRRDPHEAERRREGSRHGGDDGKRGGDSGGDTNLVDDRSGGGQRSGSGPSGGGDDHSGSGDLSGPGPSDGGGTRDSGDTLTTSSGGGPGPSPGSGTSDGGGSSGSGTSGEATTTTAGSSGPGDASRELTETAGSTPGPH